jgi:hypothetical protein
VIHPSAELVHPTRQLRAHFDERSVRIYQAFSPDIAIGALEAQTFRAPFSMNRMTWIKPSFTWMMYRSGWGKKAGQEVVLGIDIRRDGFEWALAHSSLSHFDATMHVSYEQWRAAKEASPVRIQWDPERSLRMEALPWRTIQGGIGGAAVDAYVNDWICRIADMTPLVKEIESLIYEKQIAQAEKVRPGEPPYPLPTEIASHIGVSSV